MINRLLHLTLAVGLLGCAGRPAGSSAPSTPVDPPASFQALPDTLVCVVDRASDRGLRNLTAKRGPEGEVLLWSGGEVLPLERVHPVGVVAGYAANEAWVTAREPIRVAERRYLLVGGERRIGLEQLRKAGEYRALLYFADPADEAPLDALYLPSRPGCVFRAYVREDLMSG